MKSSSPFLWRFVGGFAAGALLVVANNPSILQHLTVPAAQAAPAR